jgi:hypothetical protein
MPVVGAFAQPPMLLGGLGYDGVVWITRPNGGTCSGSLLWSGHDILTAAHSVTDGDGHVLQGHYQVNFFLGGGRTVPMDFNVDSTHPLITPNPGWNGHARDGNDLAILHLPCYAPDGADRYQVNFLPTELGQTFTMVGYGQSGVGATGALEGTSGIKRSARNTYEALNEQLTAPPLPTDPYAQLVPSANFPAGSALVYDFDDGTANHNALGYYGIANFPALGDTEGFPAVGDSGGPGFLEVGGQRLIASVVSFGFGFETDPPDINPGSESSFGAIEVDTRVSAFALWITQVVTTNNPNLPNLIDNPGFESGDFSCWTHTGNTDYDAVDGSNPHSGSYAATLGPVGSLGSLWQTVPTTPGQTYMLTYWLAHPYTDSTPNEFKVSIGGNTVYDGTNLGNFIYAPSPQFNYTATGTWTTIRFDFQEDPAYFYLDDVSFQSGGSGPGFAPRPGPRAVAVTSQAPQAKSPSSGLGLFLEASQDATLLHEPGELSGMTARPGSKDLPAPTPALNLAVVQATGTRSQALTALDRVFLTDQSVTVSDRRAGADWLDLGQDPVWAF